MRHYVVIDTNVLVSALLCANEDAATVQIVERMLAGELTAIYSREIFKEYREVLSRKKFGFSKESVNDLLCAMDQYGILVAPSSTGMILPDMKDLPFFEVVMEKREDGAQLVTGNLKHFPKEPFIVTPRQMLDILEGKTKE